MSSLHCAVEPRHDDDASTVELRRISSAPATLPTRETDDRVSHATPRPAALPPADSDVVATVLRQLVDPSAPDASDQFSRVAAVLSDLAKQGKLDGAAFASAAASAINATARVSGVSTELTVPSSHMPMRRDDVTSAAAASSGAAESPKQSRRARVMRYMGVPKERSSDPLRAVSGPAVLRTTSGALAWPRGQHSGHHTESMPPDPDPTQASARPDTQSAHITQQHKSGPSHGDAATSRSPLDAGDAASTAGCDDLVTALAKYGVASEHYAEVLSRLNEANTDLDGECRHVMHSIPGVCLQVQCILCPICRCPGPSWLHLA